MGCGVWGHCKIIVLLQNIDRCFFIFLTIGRVKRNWFIFYFHDLPSVGEKQVFHRSQKFQTGKSEHIDIYVEYVTIYICTPARAFFVYLGIDGSSAGSSGCNCTSRRRVQLHPREPARDPKKFLNAWNMLVVGVADIVVSIL